MAVSRIDEAGLNVNQYGNRNLIINGAMRVAQRGTSATVSDGSNEGYSTIDRFYLNFNAGVGGGIDFSQSSDAPSGFANSLKLQCSTTNTSFSTTDAVNLEYRPEAQDLQVLDYGTSDAKQMTISWYMKAATFTGPITLALETRDGTSEFYVKSYTPTTSWARYTCTVPGSTSATINDDSGQGMFLKFVIAGFSSGTYAKSADSTAWSTTRADYRNDIGNFTSSTSNQLFITGLQMEVGDTATDFEHRTFGDELQRCQRYCFVTPTGQTYSWTALSGYCNSTSNALTFYQFPVVMRAAPTLATSGSFEVADGHSTYNITSQSIADPTRYAARVDIAASGLTVGRVAMVRNKNDATAKITFDSEL